MMRPTRFLVTGGCGSIGSSIVFYLLKKGHTVCSLDNNEEALFNQNQQAQRNKNWQYKPFLGDIRDKKRLEYALQGITHVIHCAALKHVELLEYNPFEAYKSNIQGTNNLVEAAIECGVTKFITTSSDKAVNPTSTMGATKLLAERVTIAANCYKGSKDIQFSCVRFGNVWNTSGSVGQIFKRQCQNKEPLTLTSSNMSRFFISTEGAIELCMYALENMIGGEIFIKNMGVAEIGDIAMYFSEFYNLRDNIQIIGPKPGEKMYEALYTEEEGGRSGIIDNNYIIVLPEEKILGKTSDYWKNNPLFSTMSTAFSSLRSDQVNKDKHIDRDFFLSIL